MDNPDNIMEGFQLEDVYKRQVPKCVLSGKGCGISKTTRMLA